MFVYYIVPASATNVIQPTTTHMVITALQFMDGGCGRLSLMSILM